MVLKTAVLTARTNISLYTGPNFVPGHNSNALRFASSVHRHGIQPIRKVLALEHWNAVTATALRSYPKENKKEYCLQQGENMLATDILVCCKYEKSEW